VLRVTVHSLGAREAQDGQVLLESVGGRVVATAPVPRLDAPLDLLPRTATVALEAPDGLEGEYRIRVALPAGMQEVTQLNNSVVVRLGAH